MRTIFFLLLLGLLLPTLAAEKEALSLPDGLFLTPMSALAKLGVVRQGDVLITLTRGNIKLSLLCDTDYLRDAAYKPGDSYLNLSDPFSLYAVSFINGEFYFAPNVLEALGLKCSKKGGNVTITLPKAKPAQSVTCPLRAVPLTAKTRGCYPLLDGYEGWVLGGWSKGKWVSGEAILDQVTGDVCFQRYALEKPLGKIVIKKRDIPTMSDTEVVEEGEPADSGVTLNIGKDFTGIALAADWDAMPRVPKVQNPNQPAYRREIERILTEHGYLKIPAFTMQQLIRADFDGDGKDEVFMTADFNDEDSPVQPPPGCFRLVAVRKIIDGQVRTLIPIAKLNPSAAIDESIVQDYSIIGIVDVDGDGMQELIVAEQYYGAARTVHVFKYALDTFWEVMSGGFSD